MRIREFIVPIKWQPIDGRLWIDPLPMPDWRVFRINVENELGSLLMLQGPTELNKIAERLLDLYPALNAIELTKGGYGEVHYQEWP